MNIATQLHLECEWQSISGIFGDLGYQSALSHSLWSKLIDHLLHMDIGLVDLYVCQVENLFDIVELGVSV